MSRPRYRPPHLVAVLAMLALGALCMTVGCGGDSSGGTADATTDSDAFDAARAFADLREQVEIGPRPSGSPASSELTRRLARRLRRAGLEGVGIQRPQRNVIGTIPGRRDGFVVVGAHHDTKPGIPGFVGANDGASGVAVVLELARSLPNPMPGPSISVALFDGEESRGDLDLAVDGKRGSTQYVDLASTASQGTPALSEIEAMVLFDMVGDCDLQVPLETNSSSSLYELFSAADPETFSGDSSGVDDDHVPFLEAGIPAVDLIDFTFGPGDATGGEYWHTTDDSLDKVCPESLDAVGGAALRALPRIGVDE